MHPAAAAGGYRGGSGTTSSDKATIAWLIVALWCVFLFGALNGMRGKLSGLLDPRKDEEVHDATASRGPSSAPLCDSPESLRRLKATWDEGMNKLSAIVERIDDLHQRSEQQQQHFREATAERSEGEATIRAGEHAKKSRGRRLLSDTNNHDAGGDEDSDDPSKRSRKDVRKTQLNFCTLRRWIEGLPESTKGLGGGEHRGDDMFQKQPVVRTVVTAAALLELTAEIRAWREYQQQFIEAMERRNDTMLYNFI